jgi:hypothetical protein
LTSKVAAGAVVSAALPVDMAHEVELALAAKLKSHLGLTALGRVNEQRITVGNYC